MSPFLILGILLLPIGVVVALLFPIEPFVVLLVWVLMLLGLAVSAFKAPVLAKPLLFLVVFWTGFAIKSLVFG